MACPRGSTFWYFITPTGQVIIRRVTSAHSSDMLDISIKLRLVFVSIVSIKLHYCY
jgi:hypothetical protein